MHGTQPFIMVGKWRGFQVLPVGFRGKPCRCTLCDHSSDEQTPFTVERDELAEFGKFGPRVRESIRFNQIYQRIAT